MLPFLRTLSSSSLPHCGRCLELKSVLVINDASFHHKERIGQMYYGTEVEPVTHWTFIYLYDTVEQ
jgi:hypothetical protein